MLEHGDGTLKKLSAGAGRHIARVLRHTPEDHSKGSDGVLNLKEGVFCHASTCIVLDLTYSFKLQAIHDVLNDISLKTSCCWIVKTKVSMSVNTDYRATCIANLMRLCLRANCTIHTI